MGPWTLVLLLLTAPVLAQQSDQTLRDEIAGLKAGQEDIRKQLVELKKLLLERPAAPQRAAGPQVADVIFDLADNPVLGDSSAPLTLVEFTDYQCPYCSRHVRNTHPKIASEYIDTGKLRYASLDMPLENIHKEAFRAAMASHCADDQGKFWEMHDLLFENQRQIEPLSAHAASLGLDGEQFAACLDSEKYADSVRKDMTEAKKAGVSGTPSFVLAKTDPGDPTKVKGITFIRGAKAFDAFKAEIEQALGGLGD